MQKSYLMFPVIFLGLACASDESHTDSGGESQVASTTFASAGEIAVLDAFAPAPATPDRGAVYFTIQNSDSIDIRIVSVSVDLAQTTAIHTQRMDGDMMSMVPMEGVLVPAGESVKLQPGGVHVMLMGFVRTYGVGDTLGVEVVFEDGVAISFAVGVSAYAEAMQ